MSNTQRKLDPRYQPTPPFKSGEVVYLESGTMLRVEKVYWSLKHKQWSILLDDSPEEVNAQGLMTKRQFFLRKITP